MIDTFFFLFVGVAKRKCLENGVWGYPDYGGCSNKEFNLLQEKVWLHYHLVYFVNLYVIERCVPFGAKLSQPNCFGLT